MLPMNYTVDPTAVEESIDALPAGEYIVQAIEASYEPNSKNTGKILKITYEVLDGHFKGRKIFENLNLENPNKQAEEISRRSLNSLCLAIGLKELQSPSQILRTPLTVKLNFKKDEKYGDRNEIKKHLPLALGKAGDPAQPSQPQPNEEKKHVWEKK